MSVKKGPKRTKSNRARRKLIVSDLDGTIFFIDNSIILASMELLGMPFDRKKVSKLEMSIKRNIYNLAFSKYSDNLEPNISLMEKFFKMKREGYELIILSAREETLRKQAERNLSIYGIEYDKMILQKEPWDINIEKWKATIIEEYVGGYDEILLFEDTQKNIDEIREKLGGRYIKYFHVDKNGVKELKE